MNFFYWVLAALACFLLVGFGVKRGPDTPLGKAMLCGGLGAFFVLVIAMATSPQ